MVRKEHSGESPNENMLAWKDEIAGAVVPTGRKPLVQARTDSVPGPRYLDLPGGSVYDIEDGKVLPDNRRSSNEIPLYQGSGEVFD